MRRKILLLCTGGTIASKNKSNGLAPELGAGELLSYIPSMTENYDIDAVQICNIDSTNMKPEYWCKMTEYIRRTYKLYDGFVILHGTDTMAYTSAAISYMIQNSGKPIVITGSQKPICLDITDAKTNLMDSIIYAADPDSCGVVLVFDGDVIAGTRAKKTRARSYDAFSSVNFPVLAKIHDGRIRRYIPQSRPEREVEFTCTINENIAVLKLIPGIRPEILDFFFEHYDSLVIESYGVGGIPEDLAESFYKQKNRWDASGKLVVVATQVVNEGSNMEVYEVGQKVKREFHLMEAYDMTLEAAVTKLMYLRGKYNEDVEQIRRAFYQVVNYDILL